MKRIVLCLSALCIGSSPSAFGEGVPKLGSGEIIDLGEIEANNTKYQIGDGWGKVPIKEGQFKEVSTLEKIAKGTVNVRGATGFYLGKFAGKHVVATNNHVCPSAWSCRFSSIKFTLLGSSYRVGEFLGTWPSIDLAFLTINVPKTDEDKIAPYANPINFDAEFYRGQELVTVGFGTANNSSRNLVGNWDDDCIVFSGPDEYRLMNDPDQVNTGANKTWSFANGCDVSHGDSGSAMVDRNTGEVMGIIWTGKVPKDIKVQDSDYLERILDEESEDIWTELSYGVPSPKMKEILLEKIGSGQISGTTKSIIEEMIF